MYTKENLVFIPGNTIIRTDRFSIKNDNNVVALSIDLDLTAFKDVVVFQKQKGKISSTAWIFSLIRRSLDDMLSEFQVNHYNLFVEKNFGGFSHPIPVKTDLCQGFNIETLANEISLAKGEITKELRLLRGIRNSHCNRERSFFIRRLMDYRLKWQLRYRGIVNSNFFRKHPLYSVLTNSVLTSGNESVAVGIKSPIEQTQITDGMKFGSKTVFPVSLVIRKECLQGMSTDRFLEQLAFNIENNSSFLTIKRA